MSHDRGNTSTASSYQLFMLFVVCGLVAPTTLIVMLDVEHIELEPYRGDLEHLAMAYWLLALGCSAIGIGYLLVASRSRSLLGLNQRTLDHGKLIIVYGVAAAVSTLNILIRGRSISGRSPLPPLLTPLEPVLALTAPVLLFAIGGMASSDDRRHIAIARAMVLGVVLIGVADGFFKPGVWALLSYSLGRVASQGRRKLSMARARRAGAAGMIGVLAIALLVPVVQRYRQDSAAELGVGSRIVRASADTVNAGVVDGIEATADKVSSRQASVLAGLVRAVDRVPRRIQKLGASDFILIPTSLVPRLVWPSKPTLSNGTEISVLFHDGPADTTSSSTLTFFGESYWYGGLPIVIAASLILGAAFALVDTTFRSAAAVACRSAIVPTLIDFESNLAPWFSGNLQRTLVISALAYLLSRPTTP